jgi:hypothetical protein
MARPSADVAAEIEGEKRVEGGGEQTHTHTHTHTRKGRRRRRRRRRISPY